MRLFSLFSLGGKGIQDKKKLFGAFSIIETIVAIAILSVAVVAPLTLAQRGLFGSVYAQQQVTAFYLAQEAIEYVRSVRDGNFLASSAGASWLSGLAGCISPNICNMDSTLPGTVSQQIVDCRTDVTGCKMTYNPVTGIYGQRRFDDGSLHVGWQDAPFSRTLRITPVSIAGNANAEADLLVTVSWMSGRIQRTFTVTEKIFNWVPQN